MGAAIIRTKYVANYLLYFLIAISFSVVCFTCIRQMRNTGHQNAHTQVVEPDRQTIAAHFSKNEHVEISEYMSKNHATLLGKHNDFPDWVELHNCDNEPVDLTGWTIADRKKSYKNQLPDGTVLQPNEYKVFFLNKSVLDTDYVPLEIKAEETLYLYNEEKALIDSANIIDLQSDISAITNENGRYSACCYPTPGSENTKQAYDRFQETQNRKSIIINEIAINGGDSENPKADFIELKNISDQTISLDHWKIGETVQSPTIATIGNISIAPNELVVLEAEAFGISLNREKDSVVLIDENGGVVDYVAIKNAPANGSIGKMPDQNGNFYFASASIGSENANGKRRISDAPQTSVPCGRISDPSIVVDLIADGTIYYTNCSDVPSVNSDIWSEAQSISKTSTIRAFAVEENALPSEDVAFTYLFDDERTLPALCITADDYGSFENTYVFAKKEKYEPCFVAFYDDGLDFALPCQIKIHGDTSLILPKKGLDMKFCASYGCSNLVCDLFGDGTEEFSHLLARSGQEQANTIVRNEVCQNLAMKVSKSLLTSRGRYCDVYVNGKFYGIYALCEKPNEQYYTKKYESKQKDVIIESAPVSKTSLFYQEVVDYCIQNDMTVPENYQELCSRLDINSLIDWVILEGYFSNTDISLGNLKYVKATNCPDERWRMIFYDLDATFYNMSNGKNWILKKNASFCGHISIIMDALLKNEEFKDLFLKRASDIMLNQLPISVIESEIDKLAAEVEHDLPYDISGTKNMTQWKKALQMWKDVLEDDWEYKNIDIVCKKLNLSPDERLSYFGQKEG